MIPKFHIPKITRKLSLDANMRRLRAVSNMLRRTPRAKDELLLDNDEKPHYFYLIEQGDVGGPYDSDEISDVTVENILNFWFDYKPDPTHDRESENKKDLNSKGIHMAAVKREKSFSWDDVVYSGLEYLRDNDGDYFLYDGKSIDLGYVLELEERLLTPYEEWSNNRIYTSVDSNYVAIPDGQSYLYVDGGAWVKITYLGTTNEEWSKILVRTAISYLYHNTDLKNKLIRAGIKV